MCNPTSWCFYQHAWRLALHYTTKAPQHSVQDLPRGFSLILALELYWYPVCRDIKETRLFVLTEQLQPGCLLRNHSKGRNRAEQPADPLLPDERRQGSKQAGLTAAPLHRCLFGICCCRSRQNDLRGSQNQMFTLSLSSACVCSSRFEAFVGPLWWTWRLWGQRCCRGPVSDQWSEGFGSNLQELLRHRGVYIDCGSFCRCCSDGKMVVFAAGDRRTASACV